jgi:hypothetical protein
MTAATGRLRPSACRTKTGRPRSSLRSRPHPPATRPRPRRARPLHRWSDGVGIEAGQLALARCAPGSRGPGRTRTCGRWLLQQAQRSGQPAHQRSSGSGSRQMSTTTSTTIAAVRRDLEDSPNRETATTSSTLGGIEPVTHPLHRLTRPRIERIARPSSTGPNKRNRIWSASPQRVSRG